MCSHLYLYRILLVYFLQLCDCAINMSLVIAVFSRIFVSFSISFLPLYPYLQKYWLTNYVGPGTWWPSLWGSARAGNQLNSGCITYVVFRQDWFHHSKLFLLVLLLGYWRWEDKILEIRIFKIGKDHTERSCPVSSSKNGSAERYVTFVR